MSHQPITFYDISMRPPTEKTCCSPNPWKARFALNFKSVPYSTAWVSLPFISKLRHDTLHLPACRKYADGTPFYTLPIITDPSTSITLGDSFDIAVYLNQIYSDSGAGDLFPPGLQIGYKLKEELAILIPLSEINCEPRYREYADFNIHVDATFSLFAQLTVQCFPFDPAVSEYVKTEFSRRAGKKTWDEFELVGEARQKQRDAFRKSLEDLARVFEREEGGPFVLGERACYADMIVGGWLKMMERTLPGGEWEEMRNEWHEGVWGRLLDGLEVWAEVK